MFDLTTLPRNLAVIGGGPIGCELAQAFQRLGSQVRLIHAGGRLLDREDQQASAIVQSSLERDGVQVLLDTRVHEVRIRDGRKLVVAGRGEFVCDEVLIGAGRAPNVAGLDLAAAGVEHTSQGVCVDQHLRTTNRHVFAAGDVCLPHKFTHVADATARIVLQNALFGGRKKWTNLVIPRCTYTDPEVASVSVHREGKPVQTITQPLGTVDRAVLEDETEGFLKVHLASGTDRIISATLVARHAGEMISELTLAMTAGLGLKQIAQTVHCYPTQAEAFKRAADAYNRTRLTPGIRDWMRRYFAFLRRLNG